MSNAKAISITNNQLSNTQAKPSLLNNLCKKALLKQLSKIQVGKLYLNEKNEVLEFGNYHSDAPVVKLDIKSDDFYSDIVLGGSLGAAESYIVKNYETEQLTELTQLMLINRSALDNMDSKLLTIFKKATSRIIHAFKNNTISGSKKNIVAHYDLGNDFFKHILDDTMSYSCGVFEKDDATLKEASVAKIKRICDKLQLTENDHLLEIGTGWGGLSTYAAKNYGCKVTTTTISEEQYVYSKNLVNKLGLENLITLEKKDYRKLTGKFDKLVSIEMIEAVGHQFYSTFFQKCSSLLKDNGMMLIQAIVIDDRQYESAKNNVDFIKKYVFPGCCIPSTATMIQHLKNDTDLQLFHTEDITLDYAKTLHAWNDNFQSNRESIQKMGYSESFCRLWEYYLTYCEGGFLERAIGDIQFVAVKPRCREKTIMGKL